jgi:hypothetical protein
LVAVEVAGLLVLEALALLVCLEVQQVRLELTKVDLVEVAVEQVPQP